MILIKKSWDFLNIFLAALFKAFNSNNNNEKSKAKKGMIENKVKFKDLVKIKSINKTPILSEKINNRRIFSQRKKDLKLRKDDEEDIDRIKTLMENTENKENAFKLILYRIFENQNFKLFIEFIIIVDCIVLCLDRFPSSNKEQIIMEAIDFAIFSLFIIEIILKIYTYQLKTYLQLPFNFFVFIILILNSCQYIYEIALGINIFYPGEHLTSSKLFRVLKIGRTFHIIYFRKNFERMLFKGLYKTLSKMKDFIIMLLFFILTYSLIGMQLFSYRIRFTGNYEIPKDLYKNNIIYFQ